MKNIIQIETLFKANSGIMTTRELRTKGITPYNIRKLIKEGQLETIKRGLYKLSYADINEFVEVLKIAPKGVFCMNSSAILHELSTSIPMEYHIAIPKKNKTTLPLYPPIKLYYWTNPQYSLGIETIQKDGNLISVYDAEKTVCDFLKFRNKIGFESSKEVVKTYLNRKNRNLDKLAKYANKLGIRTIVDQYLKILL